MTMIGQEGLDFTEDLESLPPLPDQVPIPVAVTDNQLLRSRTVQSLINQSQDLMARLTVALQRNIDLEQRVEEHEKEFQTLRAEYDVYKDHTRFFKERISQLENQLNISFDEKQELENQKDQILENYKTFESKSHNVLIRLHRYQKYRARIHTQIKPYVERLKTQLSEMAEEFKSLQGQKLRQDEMIRELREKLSQAVDHIQTQHKKYEKDQIDLVNYHEDRYRTILENLGRYKTKVEYLEKKETEIEAENKTLSEKLFVLNEDFSQRTIQLTLDYDSQIQKIKSDYEAASLRVREELDSKVRTYSENEVHLQNQIILLQRKHSDLLAEYETQTKDFNNRRLELNSRVNNLELENKSLKTNFDDTTGKLKFSTEEGHQLRDQLDSLQLLYNDLQQQNEDFKVKYSSADKINKDLSLALGDLRKKNELLTEKIAQQESDFERKLTAMGTRFQQETMNLHKRMSDGSKQNQPKNQGELLSRIHLLLSEIQSGYTGHEKTSELTSEQGDIK